MGEDEKTGKLSQSEKVRNYLIGIGAISGLILGIFANAKGEPGAEAGYKTLQEMVDKQTLHIRSLDRRIYGQEKLIEGFMEGMGREPKERLPTIEEILKEEARPGHASGTTPPEEGSKAPAKKAPTKTTSWASGHRFKQIRTPQKKCDEGHVEVDGECVRVSKLVARSVKEDKEKIEETMARLEEERKKRVESEAQTRKLEKRAVQQEQQIALPPLKKLPDDLEAAKKAAE